jgi:hypothetical protein
VHENKEPGLCADTALVVQVSLIGCGDDIAKLRDRNLAPYSVFPEFGFTERLAWSKIVKEEHDIPLMSFLLPWTQGMILTQTLFCGQPL